MEEKLVLTLIENYKKQGIDLYAVLDEPMFVALPLDQKVKLLKQFAVSISRGTSHTISKTDIKNIIFDAGVAGVMSGAAAGIGTLGALAYYKKGKIPIGSLATAIALGSGVTAISTLLNSNKIVNQRKAMVNSLNTLALDRTDENAIRVLALRNAQVRPNTNLTTTSAIGSMIKSHVNDIPISVIKNISPTMNAITMFRSEAQPDSDYAAGISAAEMAPLVDEAAKRLNYLRLLKIIR